MSKCRGLNNQGNENSYTDRKSNYVGFFIANLHQNYVYKVNQLKICI